MTDSYIVVVGDGSDMSKAHAEAIKRQLTNDGFHESVVTVKEREDA